MYNKCATGLLCRASEPQQDRYFLYSENHQYERISSPTSANRIHKQTKRKKQPPVANWSSNADAGTAGDGDGEHESFQVLFNGQICHHNFASQAI